MPTMKDLVRDRLVGMVQEVRPENGDWKVVVVDKTSVKILSGAVSLSDIMDHNVTVIENLEVHPRQPMPDMDAIYFVTPTQASISGILQDFEGKRRTYGNIHLYFTSHLDDSLLDHIKRNKVVLSRIRTLKELNIEFRPYESQVYLLDDISGSSFNNLYSPQTTGSQAREQSQLAAKLMTLCITLNDFPIIRFSKTNNAQVIAQKLQKRLEEFARIPGTDWRPNMDQQATLLILDRSVDPLSPLMHECTYQAMIFDLLDIRNDRYQHKSEKASGEEQVKDVLLNETDPVWSKLRHLFFADAAQQVSSEFAEFRSKNKAAQFNKGEGGGSDLKAMSEVMRQMPQYRELMEKYSLHLGLAQQCMNAMRKDHGGLSEVAMQEQNMAMGEDPEGRTAQPLGPLSGLLRDANLSPMIKLRLMMIYTITQGSLRDQDRRKLMEQAQISAAEEQALYNLQHVGVSLEKPQKKFFMKSDKKERRRKVDEEQYEHFRYRPTCFFLGKDVIEGNLNSDDYPAIKEPSGSSSASRSDTGKAASARSRPKAGWALKGKDKKGAEETQTFTGPRVIIFCLGGVSYSEMRSAYELTKMHNREVLVGSTSTMLPAQYVGELKKLESGTA